MKYIMIVLALLCPFIWILVYTLLRDWAKANEVLDITQTVCAFVGFISTAALITIAVFLLMPKEN